VVRLLPPLVIKQDEAQELVKRLSDVIKAFLKQ
jgi:acetylornithine/succinyldiaminopimelate/putrescine aminotransferase